jgi:SCP-2 sterol transfer family protein/CHAT domain-containing protein
MGALVVTIEFLSPSWAEALQAALRKDPLSDSAARKISDLVIQFVVDSPKQKREFWISVRGGRVSVGIGHAPTKPNVIISQDYRTAVAAMRGEAPKQHAFMQGQTQISGDLTHLTRAEPIMSRLPRTHASLNITYPGLPAPARTGAGLAGRLPGDRPLPRPGSISQARATSPRYANVVLLDLNRKGRLYHLRLGQVAHLRVDIGPRLASDVPWPDDRVPLRDLWLDVMLSSAQFAVGSSQKNLGRSHVVHSQFLLPMDRRKAARTSSGRRFIDFVVRLPGSGDDVRARLSFYYRDALVQSKVLKVQPNEKGRNFTVETDFTVSENLEDVELIDERRRFSLLLNEDNQGTHQVTYRTSGESGSVVGGTFELRPAVGDIATELRNALASRAPTRRRRRKKDLVDDLRALAPMGARMYEAFKFGLEDGLANLHTHAGSIVLSISRPSTSAFTLPWSLTYDIFLDSEQLAEPESIPLCPLVEDWDESTALIEGLPQSCPADGEVDHDEGLLCPFGFWGYRYSLELLTRCDKVIHEVQVPGEGQLAAILSRQVNEPDALQRHVDGLESMFTSAFASAPFQRANDKKQARKALGLPLSLVYFYCHGIRPKKQPRETYLAVGNGESISPGDFGGWVDVWMRSLGRRPWETTRPLVFINACHSVEIAPSTVADYVEAFVASGHASGVIGTEVPVDQGLAVDFAQHFFEWLTRPPEAGNPVPDVDSALRSARIHLLTSGNLFGLAYAPYCWANLKYTPGTA